MLTMLAAQVSIEKDPNGAGLRMTNTKHIYPTDGTGAANNGDINLGENSWRFKNAYFNGTVNTASLIAHASGNTSNAVTISIYLIDSHKTQRRS